MDKKTGKFTTKIRKHLRPTFAKEKHQTTILNEALEAHYDTARSDLQPSGRKDTLNAANAPKVAEKASKT